VLAIRARLLETKKMVKNPHIVFITSGHSPFSSRLFYKELRSLKKYYNDLSIIAPYHKQCETIEDIRIIGIAKYKSRYNRLPALYALYKKAIELEPDIVHCHEPDSLLVAYILKKRFPQIKVIYDCHEFHPYSFTENYPCALRNLAKRLLEKFENFLSSEADSVITVNQRLVARFKKHNRATVELPNYPSLKIIPNNLERRELFSSSKVKLIYVGRLSAERGIFLMLNLLSELRKAYPVELTLIGNFHSFEQEKQFFSDVDESKLGSGINYTGYLPYEQTILNLLQADIGLFLARGKERYKWSEPIKYFEYSAAGLPVVMSDFPATRALGEQNENGIVVPVESIVEAVKAVSFLITNKQEAKKMAENGRIAFYQRYNWEIIEPRLFALYQSLL